MAKIIAFVSGKGGTGKSSLCAAMATILAKSGKNVLCIDCCVGLPGLERFLGMYGEGFLSFREVCRGDYRVDQATASQNFPKLQVLTAPIHFAEADVDGEAFAEMLEAARTKFDYILLDGPAGIGPMFRIVSEYADQCIVVTLPDYAAIGAARRVGDELENMRKMDVRLVVNRVNERMLKAMHLTIDDIVDQAGLQLLGLLPVDTDVLEAAALNLCLIEYTKRGAAAAADRICARMEGDSVKIPMRAF